MSTRRPPGCFFVDAASGGWCALEFEMFDWIRQLFSDNFAPHVYCLRNTGVVPLDAVSDTLIAAAYMLIPAALIAFFQRRRDLRFSWMFVLFGIFICSCGFTHVLGVWTLWHPIYRVEAAVKVVTAVSSVLTAIMLWKILPALLTIPSPDQLQVQVDERTAAEAEVRRLNSELEARVAERTADLTLANQALREREEELRSAQERLRFALDAGRIGIWDHDVVNDSIRADKRCREAFGIFDNREICFRDFLSSIHPDDLEGVQTTLANTVAESTDGRYTLEYRTVGVSDRLIRYVQVQGRVLFETEAGPRRPTRFLGTLSDVTERKLEQDALRHANEDLRQFAFAAAHDLQEPLRNVAVSVQLLEMKCRDILDGEGRELIAQSVEGAQRVNDMLKDLLTYSRVVERDGEQVEVAIPAVSALEDALSNLRSRLQESGAEIQVGDLPVVTASKLHLSQIFQNLIGNAIKYRKPDQVPVVKVLASRHKSKWMFEVVDNGIGFNPIYADKIFGMFKRLHGRAEYPGNGVGLALCSRIVNHYGGDIWAESQPGHGSTFRFTLPS